MSICLQCGSIFTPKNNTRGKFCSRVCWSKAQQTSKVCLQCGQSFIARRQKNYCSRACSNKSRTGIKYNQGRPRDKARRRELQREMLVKSYGEKCYRCNYHKNPKILQVHHINGRNIENADHIDNLELLCPNCHAEEHYG